ncbi:MAG: hypothetical protein MK116_02795 [Phycisphaerales bacterium]|nr:hypothetical protein [Phycisphaerales bacterium]
MSGISGRAAGRRVVLAAALLLASFATALGQESDPGSAEAAPEAVTLQFNFKGASFDQVLDYFSRATGKPVIQETGTPEGTLDFLSPETYDLDEGLSVLNVILQSRGVMLRVEDDMLYLQKLTEMQRENVPTFIGEIPTDITPDQVVTVVRPLESASAQALAERLAQLVAAYGSVTSMPGQNSIVITETAAQVRRLLMIISELDQQAPDALVEVVPVKNTSAVDLMEPLKALLMTKVVKYMPDKKGNLRKVEEESLSGLNLAADVRTNSIIGKGPRPSLDKLKEIIAVLDVSSSAGRSVRTVGLATMSPNDAKKRLTEVFGRLPEARRPVIMPRADEPAVTIVGERGLVDEGVQLLNELDGGISVEASAGLVLEAVPLEQADPGSVIKALEGLLNQRQKSLVRLVSGPDGRSLLMSGPADDVTAVGQIIPVLDRADGVEQEVRMVRLDGPGAVDPAGLVEAANQLHGQRLKEDSRLTLTTSDDGRVVTLVGPRREVESWIEMVDLVSEHYPLQQETRQYRVTAAAPSSLVQPLKTMVAQMMPNLGGAETEPPRIEAIDTLDILVVSGSPRQLKMIDQLVKTLDQRDPSDFRVQVIDVSDVQDLGEIMARARTAWENLRGDPGLPMPDIEADAQTGRLLVSGSRESVSRYEQAIATFRKLEVPVPDLRMIPLRHASAADVASYLAQFAAEEQGLLRSGGRPAPFIDVIDRTNTLVVSGSDEQQRMIGTLVQSLDVQSAGERAPLRILQLQVADAAGLARTLSQQYDARSVQDRTAQPVRITADPATNSLFVSAHPDVVGEIETIVTNLNTVDRIDRDGREIRIFPLRVARAEELGQTIDEMFPEPPMPKDRRGTPMPHLQEPREVVVRADPQTNSLIVEAPVARMASFEQLVEQLDRQKVVEEIEVRTYQPVHADLSAMANTLRQLADSGSLNQDMGDRRGTITITTEPVSHTLIVSGPAAIFPKVEQVLEELDVKRAAPVTTLRFFALDHADATRLANTLRDVLLVRMREELPGGTVALESLLNVSADDKTNTLIISAPTALMPVVQTLIEQLDTPAAARSRHAVRIRPLDFADAGSITSSLSTALRELTSTTTGEPVDARLIASPGANALIMVGLPEDLDQVETLVATLDARPSMDAINARTYALKHADAGRLSPIVQRLLADQQASDPRLIMERIRRSRGQVDLTPPIRVEADNRTNSLIVSGPARTVALAETLITQLDVPDERASHTWKTYTPANTDAPTLADTVRRLLNETSAGGPASELVLTAEPLSGAVVVTGLPDEVDRAIKILASWDNEASPTPRVELRVLRVEHGDARTVAQVLTPLLRDRQRWPADLQQMARSGRAVPEPNVTVDAPANRIIISAPAPVVAIAKDLLDELDRPMENATAIDVQVIALQQAQATEVAKTLNESIEARARLRPGEPRPAVSAQPSGNAIIVTGTPQQIDDLRGLVARLDDGLAPDQTQVRTVYLQHARAERVAPIVEQLLVEDVDPNMAWFSSRRGVPMPEANDVRVVADPRLNAVVVAATPAILAVAEQMVSQLDVDPSTVHTAALRRVAVMQVRNADARELAASLDALFAESGTADPPTVRVDGSSNTLLVRGDENQLSRIRDVVRDVDAATLGTSRQVHLVPIDPARGSAADVAESLRRMLDRGGGSRVEVIKLEDLLHSPSREDTSDQGRIGPRPLHLSLLSMALGTWSFRTTFQEAADVEPDISVAVDPATNSLVIVGSDRAVKRARAVLEQLVQQMPAAAGTVRRIELGGSADAASLAQMLRQTMNQMSPPGGTRGDLLKRTSVVADERDNALVLVCNDADFRMIGDLISALARGSAGGATVVKSYPLSSISSDQAVRSVQGLLQGDARRRGQQASRMRSLALRTLGDETAVEAIFRPDMVSVIGDGASNAIIVMAPSEAVEFIDKFIELIDQSPVSQVATLKLFKVNHARAAELGNTLGRIFRARHRDQRRSTSGQQFMEPEFGADQRTNMLLVTASPQHLKEVEQLLEQLDQPVKDASLPLRSVVLKSATPSRAAKLLDEVVFGVNPARRLSAVIVADDASGTILVRADKGTMDEINLVLAEIDRDPTNDFDVRTLTVERADVMQIAESLQRLFDDRARLGRAGGNRAREAGRRVTIVGNPATRLLLVSASDEDFDQVEKLVKQFDSPQAAESLDIRAIPLENANAAEIAETVQEMVAQLETGQSPWWYASESRRQLQGRMAIYPDSRLNALIVSGTPNSVEMVERIVDIMDAEKSADAERTLKVYRVENVPVQMLEDVVEGLHGTGTRRWWQPPTSTDVDVMADEPRRALIVAAPAAKHAAIAALVDELELELAGSSADVLVLPVKYAEAAELENILERFVRQRDDASGSDSGTMVIASRTSNSIILSGPADELPLLKDIISKVDVEDASGDRTIEIVTIKDGEVAVIAGILREQFGRRGANQVMVTTVPQTRSLVLNAPTRELEQVRALIAQLDTRAAEDETIIRTFALDGARAGDVVDILRETLQLDDSGEARGVAVRLEPDQPAVEVHARVVADARSNSLVVTATEDSLPVIEALIRQLDEEPAAVQVEYRIFQLEHALAEDVRWNLYDILPTMGDPSPRVTYNRMENQLIVSATPDQFKQIEMIVDEFDQPSSVDRSTKFIPLEFAEAEKVRQALTVFYGPLALDADTPSKLNVRIVADPATNSLVISAEEQEWEALNALIKELDAEEYDAALQLKVIPLTYADAVSVARAINDAFQQQVRRGGQKAPENNRGGNGREGSRQDVETPTVLVQAEDWVRASAEPLTNSVVVSASRKTLLKIETIVAQLDKADHAGLPPARVIPVRTANPEQLAESVRTLYETPGREGRVNLRIVGDVESSTLIVRAPEADFLQIMALAKAIEDHGDDGGMGVHVIRLENAPAARVADAIRGTYETRAEALDAALQVEVDSATNSLVVAATAELVEEIKDTVLQLDDLAPASGLGIFIIELEHVDPQEAIRVIRTIGLDKPQDEGSVMRLLGEPIRVSPMRGRRAVVVVASPADEKTITGIFKALDAEPELATAEMRVVLLRNAEADVIADLLSEILSPGAQQVDTPMAKAVQEQIRRLSVKQDGINQSDLGLDLTQPIRVIAHETRNALLVSSTRANVSAVVDLVGILDQLPVTDTVIVRMFPLENIPAEDFARIIRTLFEEGKALGNVPGGDVAGVPAGTLGRALLDEVAIAVDDRTNTVVIAGKEDSVAAVEVISERLDSDLQAGWVEPRLVSLTWADAEDIAQTLNRVLVEGATDLPQAGPLQRQVGRLRMARMETSRVIESQVFQPMHQLIIEPQSQMRALMLVGTPVNLDLVSELVAMLDVEAASPASTVRIYPVEHASAARLSTTIELLFREQVSSGVIRKEDRVIIQSDERTNALVVTTSARSFAIVESLLEALDTEMNADLQEIRRLSVTHASAARLADVVQRLMDARVERLRLVEPETADLQRATIIPDDRTNTLVIAAGNESYDVIQMLVEQMDEANVLENALVEVVGVGDSNPDRLASAINAIMERRYADMPGQLKNRRQPLILTDPRTSSLLVSADPEDLASIQELVKQLMATPIAQAVDLHVVPVASGSNADRLAPRLQQLMRDRQQSLGEAATASDRVSVTAESASNSLIVAASQENLVIVREMVALLVQAEADTTAGREFEVLALRGSSAEELVGVLNDLYVEEANRNRGSGTVRVSAEPRLNSILISAPQSDIAALRSLVVRLDGAKPAFVIEIRHFPLKSANSLETVRLIEDVLSGRGIGARRRTTQQTTVLRYVREIEDAIGDTEFQVSAALRESISLTPDIRTNTVIVRAPRESMELIGRMIRDLDDSSEGSKNIRIFKLKNADAMAMREVLMDLFRLDEGEDLLVLKPRDQLAGVMPVAEGLAPMAENVVGGTELTAVPDPRQQLAITVDSRTNSLLVSGSPAYLELVEEVVTELDELEANERETIVYQLRNATAENVATVLGEFVEEEQRKLVQTLGGDQLGSAARLLEREITIRGDQKSNTVLVSTSPRYMERIESVIQQLDVDPPQVLIQLMLAEVTLEGGFDWGVSVDASGSIGTVSLGGVYDLVGSMAMGAPTLTVASSDFDVMLKALETQGRFNLLSNPSIMTANNEQATINVGETIYVPTSSQTFDTGVISVPLEAKETGVLLNVTPSINPDGFVRLDVNPTLSRVLDQTDEPAVGVQTPRILQRTADTTVTVADGQTIILGGLIEESYEYTEESIPLLGDLPLIGFLFRGERQDLRRTELIIVLTPHVITSPADRSRIDDLTTAQIDTLPLPENLRDKIKAGQLEREGIFKRDNYRLELKDLMEADETEGLVPPKDAGESDSPRGDE